MPGGPKKLSAAVLQKRGSRFAPLRAQEERQQQGRAALIVPKRYSLPRDLSTAARTWGLQLMSEAFYDASEAKLLIEMLRCWDDCQKLRKFVALSGHSQIDKNGISRQRPEARMLAQSRQILVTYTRVLKVQEK